MKNRSAKLLCVVFIIIGALLLDLAAPVSGLSEEFWSGTVTVNVNLRKTPSLQGHIISGLLQGSRVKVYAESDGWYRVSAKKYHQVFNGWVSIEYVAIAAAETTATAPDTETLEPDTQAQSRSSDAESVQSAPAASPEKPLPAPDVKSPAPETKAQVIPPEPEPDHQAKSLPPAAEPVQSEPTVPSEKPLPTPDTKTPPPETKAPDVPPEPEPENQAQSLPPAEEPIQSVPSAPPEKLLSTPDVKTPPPETKAPDVPPESEPDKHIVAEPPKAKIADTKTERPPRVKKSPLPDAGAEPADDPIFLLPTALPVVAIVVLLIVFIVYRKRRASGSNAGKPGSPVEPAPAAGSPPPVENSRVSAASELTEEDLPADAELEVASLPEDGTLSAGDDSSTEVVSFFNQVMEKVNRMSDGELAELLGMIDGQLGEKQRKNDRLTFYTMVDYVVEDQYYRDFIQDLSVSGVFIKARQMFEPGQHITMTFMSPFLQKPFKISGKIVRTLDTGIGVNFDKESQVQTEAISALMDQIRKIEKAG